MIRAGTLLVISPDGRPFRERAGRAGSAGTSSHIFFWDPSRCLPLVWRCSGLIAVMFGPQCRLWYQPARHGMDKYGHFA